jgi:hypothetical protein
MTNTAAHAVKITDDYDDCQRCGRTGLVRVVVMSDGSHVGTECMKKVCGWAPAKKDADALRGLVADTEITRYGETFILWTNAAGAARAITRNAMPQAFGPDAMIRSTFARYAA